MTAEILDINSLIARSGNSEALFKVLTDAMPQMVWSTLPDGYHDYYNARWYEFTGVPEGSTDGEAWNGMFHPDDQERAWARWRHSLETGEPYEIEYRLRHRSGTYRWTLGRALPVRDSGGEITRWIGTCTDIDAAKRAASQTEILSRELSHRIKNIFSVINGLIGLSARRDPSAAGFASTLQKRLAALGRAHEFVRPHSEQSRPTVGETTLRSMLNDLFSPYPAVERGHLCVEGDDTEIDDSGATAISLIFHELATNATKYGALAVEHGKVTVTLERRAEHMIIRWLEEGLNDVTEPTKFGFGTRLTNLSVQQLGERSRVNGRQAVLTPKSRSSLTSLSGRTTRLTKYLEKSWGMAGFIVLERQGVGNRILDDARIIGLGQNTDRSSDAMTQQPWVRSHEQDRNTKTGSKNFPDPRARRSIAQVQVDQGQIRSALRKFERGTRIRRDPDRLIAEILENGFKLRGDEDFILNDQNFRLHDGTRCLCIILHSGFVFGQRGETDEGSNLACNDPSIRGS